MSPSRMDNGNANGALEDADAQQFLTFRLAGEEYVVGILVDAVSDVITLSAAQIKPAPTLGNGAETSHIIGFGTLDERMRILMDVEKLMAGTDMGLVDKALH